MSEIPFVNRLGDALEGAIAAKRAPRRRWTPRRRLLVIVVAIAAAIGASLAVARILSSPTKLAISGISCFDGNLAHGEFYLDAGDRTPVEACADAIRRAGYPVPALVACDWKGRSVSVTPGSGRDACRRAGLAPLPHGYSSAHARVQKLSRGILSIEASSDCIPPRRLAARVQALLRRSGWEGWRVSVRSGGPCGSVSERIGDGSREVSGNGGNLDYETRRVIVHAGPYPSTQKLLDRLEVPLMEMSSKLCYTQAALRREVRRRLARTRRHVAFEVIERKVGEWSHERQARLDAGCALVAVARSAIDGFGIVVVIEQNG